jgi:hypothetical protein
VKRGRECNALLNLVERLLSEELWIERVKRRHAKHPRKGVRHGVAEALRIIPPLHTSAANFLSSPKQSLLYQDWLFGMRANT